MKDRLSVQVLPRDESSQEVLKALGLGVVLNPGERERLIQKLTNHSGGIDADWQGWVAILKYQLLAQLMLSAGIKYERTPLQMWSMPG